MSWDRIEGQWKQRRGKATHHWGKIMNDDLAAIAGKYEELVGRLQEKYGIAKAEAKQQVDEFKKTVGQLKKANGNLVRLQKSLQKKSSWKPLTSRVQSRTRKHDQMPASDLPREHHEAEIHGESRKKSDIQRGRKTFAK
jgi:uncharacterized protein YjbJ (UPF0337 family)